ncbi:MAG: GNAT family N-acetyltransferase [Lachnospiraceae bacterium]|nr:GNAT family N-acetyltransferase [Lachnospiraceae bacterium]
MKDARSMDNYVDERDYRLLEDDKYTFFVLGRIMGGDCRILLTDHERMIICHSNNPFPVWIWTPDNATEAEMEEVYQLTNDIFPFDKGYTFNIKYELAEYFIKRADEEEKKLTIKINMFAYDCLNLLEPEGNVEGKVHQCTVDDIEEITEIYDLFQRETGIGHQSYEQNRANAEYSVNNNNIFFWEDGKGEHVASCTYRPNGNGELASIELVYTREDARRKHYAENLVYNITKKAQDEGYVPMLYTNADYVASNACYEKIGYVLRGKLCTVGE